MLNWFNKKKISTKLKIIVFSAIVMAILLSVVVFLMYDRSQYKKSILEESKVLAEILSERSAVAVTFNDLPSAEANLHSLIQRPSTRFSCIYNLFGELFTAYIADPLLHCPDTKPELEAEFGKNHVTVGTKITVNGREIGVLILSTNLNAVNERSRRFLLISLIVVAVSILLALVVVSLLEKAITKPIENLKYVAQDIIKRQDYSVRCDVQYNDETAQLTQAFNQMLHNIQEAQLDMTVLVDELQESNERSQNEADNMAKRNTSIRNYFSGVSHDLKQPLQAIEMFSSILLTNPEIDPITTVGKLRDSVTNLRQMFDDWLNLAKLEESINQNEKKWFAVKPLILSIVNEVSILAADKHLSLRMRCPEVEIYSNEKMLERIIRNLLSNSIRYTESGGILLACRKRNNGYCIEVWDTGIGISPGNTQRVFDQFVQVAEHKKESAQGYGLGLSIVKRLSDALNHKLSVFSKLEFGTVFKVDIVHPKIKKKKAVKTTKLLPVTTNKPSAVNLFLPNLNTNSQGAKVLVIDDDEIILDAIATQINTWGIEVLCAVNCHEAVEMCQHIKVDVVVSDYQLTDEFGDDVLHEVIKCIEKNHKHKASGFIISATNEVDVIEKIKSSGFDFLAKPVKPAQLRAKIEYLLRSN